MNILKQQLQQYKVPLVILALIILGTIFYNYIVVPVLTPSSYDTGTPDDPSFIESILNPSLTTPVNPEVTTPVPVEYMRLEKATPKSGPHETFDGYEGIKLDFTAPIAIETLELTVKPNIPVKTEVYPDFPNSLVITPSQQPWEDDVRYDFKINIVGLSGEVLRSPVTYTYLKEFPKNAPAPLIP